MQVSIKTLKKVCIEGSTFWTPRSTYSLSSRSLNNSKRGNKSLKLFTSPPNFTSSFSLILWFLNFVCVQGWGWGTEPLWEIDKSRGPSPQKIHITSFHIQFQGLHRPEFHAQCSQFQMVTIWFYPAIKFSNSAKHHLPKWNMDEMNWHRFTSYVKVLGYIFIY